MQPHYYYSLDRCRVNCRSEGLAHCSYQIRRAVTGKIKSVSFKPAPSRRGELRPKAYLLHNDSTKWYGGCFRLFSVIVVNTYVTKILKCMRTVMLSLFVQKLGMFNLVLYFLFFNSSDYTEVQLWTWWKFKNRLTVLKQILLEFNLSVYILSWKNSTIREESNLILQLFSSIMFPSSNWWIL